jgi:hypothetical protein
VSFAIISASPYTNYKLQGSPSGTAIAVTVGRSFKTEGASGNMTQINTAGVLIVAKIFRRLKKLETIASSIMVAFNPMRVHFAAPMYIKPSGYGVRKEKKTQALA